MGDPALEYAGLLKPDDYYLHQETHVVGIEGCRILEIGDEIDEPDRATLREVLIPELDDPGATSGDRSSLVDRNFGAPVDAAVLGQVGQS